MYYFYDKKDVNSGAVDVKPTGNVMHGSASAL
jgi:hypothetical protein